MASFRMPTQYVFISCVIIPSKNVTPMAKTNREVFSMKRFGLLLLLAIVITIGLYYIDSDTPTDTLLQRGFNVLFVFGVIIVIYTLANLRKLRS